MSRRRDTGGGGGHRHYRLVHRSTYTYPAPVASSYGRAMLLPRDGGGQRVHRAALTVSPGPAEQAEHVDVGGNRSVYFHVATEHTVLEVVASSLVTVSRRVDAATLPPLAWDRAVASLSGMRATGRGEHGEGPSSVMTIVESALPSELAAPDERVLEYALPSFRPGAPLVAVVADLAHRVHADLAHRPGATAEPAGRSGPAGPADVLQTRSGAGQDLAHLTIAALRSLGLSARFVSGYVDTAGHMDTPAPGPEQSGPDGPAGAVHGWVAVWVPGGGWLHVDPGNDRLVDERYVVLGWGRDAGEVTPLRGIAYSADDGARLETAVQLVRLSTDELHAELNG